MKHYKPLLAALMIAATAVSAHLPATAADASYDMAIQIDLAGETKAISPYIYGINQYANQSNYKNVTVNAVRQGGNRMTAYNWENNASNAGSDWQYSSDNNLTSSDAPGDCVQTLSKEAAQYGFDYKLTTLQLAGYVAADKDGNVSAEETAPSDRWNEVILTKGSAFSDTPDLDDGVVYMDEYVNFIVNTLGDSSTATGIQGYSLDNEPALWHTTHNRVHPEPVSMTELRDKSIEMAAAIKAIDPGAEVFGPALYGYTAYDHLADDDSSTEWETIKAQGGYHWYIDYYLDEMRKAEDTYGTRLLDVLDIHYYSESAREGVADRLQSVRTLYEEGFVENSWIGQWCQENIPILPTIQASIDKYYPGTKLAISEYNFGGEDLSGTIVHAEALGCYADAGVYLATLWGGNPYQFAAINLYTNYDGKGSSFGDTLVPTQTEDVSLSSAYSAIQGSDQGTVTAMITNKDLEQAQNATISLANANTTYEAAAVYAVYGDSSEIRLIDVIDDVSGNTVNVTLPAYSAAMVVVTDDASDFDGLTVFDPDRITQEIVTIDDPMDRINANGFVEIPITDPEHLVRIDITGNVTSSAGSSWGSAGCAVCINAEDSGGNAFWTSEGYTLALGNGSTASVYFDGTLSNDGVYVPAVVADGKVELQQWWSSSEKQDAGVDDVIAVEYTQVQVVYEYESGGATGIVGDVNASGAFDLADVVALQKWLLGSGTLADWKAGDLCADGVINGLDLSRMRQELEVRS